MPGIRRAPSRAQDTAHSQSTPVWWGSVASQMADASRKFGRDLGCITLVDALALVAVIMGRDAILTLGFATLFMVLVPLYRYFRLIR